MNVNFQYCQGKSRRCMAVIVVTTIILVVLTHQVWLSAIGNLLVVTDPLQPADAIVPLAGGKQRVVYASDLYHSGYATWFVVTDISLRTRSRTLPPRTQIEHTALGRGVPASQLRMTNQPASSTYQEALAIRQLTQLEGWQSLIVVTSPEHTRRSQIIFQHVFRESGVNISIQPAFNRDRLPPRWWKMADRRQFVFNEYVKLMVFVLGYHVE